MITTKLYNIDSYIFDFEADVISCTPVTYKGDKLFEVVLDRTAFFPESGGQYGDTGNIGSSNVTDTQEKNGTILHYCKSCVSGKVNCSVDHDTRFAKMQNHTGEHIMSGIAHSLFGCTNTGFHLSDNEMTVDYDVFLTKEQLEKIEFLSNKAVFDDLSVTVSYPEASELPHLEYRSKLDLTENVRLVTIDGIDVCACCAPHVKRTGEVGLIKILDSIRYKGGIRLRAVCGVFALSDYKNKCESNAQISHALSSKADDTFTAVSRLIDENKETAHALGEMKRAYAELLASTVKPDKNIAVFDERLDMLSLRSLLNLGVGSAELLFGVFSGNDTDGYKYLIGSKNVKLLSVKERINKGLCARGGGSDEMLQGSTHATRKEIESFFEGFEK